MLVIDFSLWASKVVVRGEEESKEEGKEGPRFKILCQEQLSLVNWKLILKSSLFVLRKFSKAA